MFFDSFVQNDCNLNGPDFKSKYQSNSNAVLIDVRTPEEFSEKAIDKALNIDFLAPDFMAKFLQLDKSKTYFLYCRSGRRSADACAALQQKGYKVFNLVGGIGAWPTK